MGKRIFARAPLIDDESGLKTKPIDNQSIPATITYLSYQFAGRKNIFTRDKLINVGTIQPQTQRTPVKITRFTRALQFGIQKKRFNDGKIYHNI